MRSKENKQHKFQVDIGSRINRLYILLTVMVVMAGALFVGQEALAKVFTGTAGDDTLVGTDGEDRLKGRAGEDRLKGRRGADRLKGNRGEDRLKGNRGNDKIIPGKGSDKVYAGAGNDRIYARHRRGGSHRLRIWFRQGRDHTPWGPDQEQLRENPRASRRCDDGNDWHHPWHYEIYRHHHWHEHHDRYEHNEYDGYHRR